MQNKNRLSKVAVTLGDPAGIGPEIVLKSIVKPSVRALCEPVLFGSLASVRQGAEVLGMEFSYRAGPESESFSSFEVLLDGTAFSLRQPKPALAARISGLGYSLAPTALDAAWKVLDGTREIRHGQVDSACGALAFLSIALAVEACPGDFSAMATAPVHKEALRAAEVPFIGHTEILGALSGVEDPLTMFETLGLRVFFLSRHVSLRKACDLITKSNVLNGIRRCWASMRSLGLADGTLAVAGLNPHCGEHGLFGDEEDREVTPAVEAARAEGIPVVGPIGADSVFHMAKIGQFAAVLSLYHDQGHIATKTLDFDRTISLTLGLPYLRTSVDHGTAFDIAGTGTAREISMEESIRVAARYAERIGS